MYESGPVPSRSGALRPVLAVAAGVVVLGGAAYLVHWSTRSAAVVPQTVAVTDAPAPSSSAAVTVKPDPQAPVPPQLLPEAKLSSKDATPGLGTLMPPTGEAQRPSFDIVRISPAGEAVLAGRAKPGADVTITGNGQEIGRTRADEQGQWVITPDRPLPAGGQELTVASRTPEGTEARGEAPVVVIVPDRAGAPKPFPPAPAASAASAPAAPGPESDSRSAVALLVPPDAAPRLLQAPAGEQRPDGRKLGLDVMDYGEHGDIRFAGSAPPGSRVRVYVDNTAAGEVVADPHGHWDLVPSQPIATGGHQVRLDQINAAGGVANRVELPVQRASISVQDAAQGRTIVQPGQNLWLIARHVYGQGMRYTTIYQANRDQIRDPNKIYPGQLLATPTSLPDSAVRSERKGSSAAR